MNASTQLSRPIIRQFIYVILPSDSDLDALCGDHFPEVARRFTNAMDRIAKVNLLLDLAAGTAILMALQTYSPQRYLDNYHIIASSLANNSTQMRGLVSGSTKQDIGIIGKIDIAPVSVNILQNSYLHARYEFVLSGSVSGAEIPKLRAIEAHLRQIFGQTDLTITITEKGSTILACEGMHAEYITDRSVADVLSIDSLQMLCDGDQGVMAEFLIRIIPIFRTQVRLSHKTDTIAPRSEKDLVQELCEEALKRPHPLEQWDPRRGISQSNLLRYWARHKIRDHQRTGAIGRVNVIHDREMPLVYWEKLKTLFENRASPIQSELFQRVYVNGERPKDVAVELGISEHGLHKRLARLRTFLLKLRYEFLAQEDN